MEIQRWEQRYRSRERAAEDYEAAPAPLLIRTAAKLHPARALDLACGTGRHTLWLAEHGWRVTAVDGSPSAIEVLLNRASERRLKIQACIADLQKHEFEIAPGAWDLVAICYYLQRDLFAPAKKGVATGGVLLAVAHLAAPGEGATPRRLRPGELRKYFRNWEILHYYEGSPSDPAHKRPVGEIVARRPERL